LTVFISLSFNCSNSNEVDVDENTIADRLTFKTNITNTKDGIIIVRVSWSEWGRTSRNCDGWGLCNATVEWFPEPEEKSTIISDYNYSFPINYNETKGSFYVEILLDAPVPSDIPINDYPIKVEEEISLNSKESLNEDLKINIGDYYFDETLGEYGGFIIYLEKR
jgi:hypothetical protein